MRALILVAVLLSAGALAEERRPIIIGTMVPLGDGIEFVLMDKGGCRTQHREIQILHGAVLGSGMDDIPYVAGCWERLPNDDIRVYIDQWRPEYQVTTVPVKDATEGLITVPKEYRPNRSLRARAS